MKTVLIVLAIVVLGGIGFCAVQIFRTKAALEPEVQRLLTLGDQGDFAALEKRVHPELWKKLPFPQFFTDIKNQLGDYRDIDQTKSVGFSTNEAGTIGRMTIMAAYARGRMEYELSFLEVGDDAWQLTAIRWKREDAAQEGDAPPAGDEPAAGDGAPEDAPRDK